MKTTLSIAASFLALTTVAGCGFAARSPEMYRDDTKAVLETRNNDIRACYDGVLAGTPGVSGKVTIKFDVENEQGKITNPQVDPAGTTAPQPVADCVIKNIAGLGLTPPDARKGEGTWVWEFSAPPPPAPAAAPKS